MRSPALASAAQPSRNPAARGFTQAESALDGCFGPASNPLRHLGALGFLLFWVVAATGAYVYVVFETSVAGAYASTRSLSAGGLGAVVRTLHRYASDAFVAVMLLHLGRELAFGRFAGFRRFTWTTGVPLLWLTIAAGVTGFWLAWDQVAAFSVVATTEWLDALGVFGEPLARNFLGTAAVTDRLFSLFVFLHIGLPLLVLGGMWLHIQRLARADTRVSRPLAAGTLLSLLALALLEPAPLAEAADLATLPSVLAFDWFYLAPNALSDRTSAWTLWLLAGGATAGLCLLPSLARAPRPPAAVVDPAHCNGCSRCFEDCPYGAVTMAARGAGAIAVVDADLCASCGICAGACPSATPFRSLAVLATGIDLPHDPLDRTRAALNAALAAGSAPVVAFGCRHGAALGTNANAGTVTIVLECAGQLPPAFVDYALRRGARGVAVVHCREGACEYRLGDAWARERLAGLREPHLRASVPRERLYVFGAGPGEAASAEARLRHWARALPAVPAETHRA